MPDRYGEPRDLDTWPAMPPPGGQHMPDDVWAAQQRAMAIAACELCDDDGYRGCLPCDHQDHYAQTEHGRALAKAELAKIRQRKGNPSHA